LKTLVTDAGIDDIAHLSDLKGLEFEISELTDAALPRIDSLFPKLDRLTFSGSNNLDANAIANMKIIHKLGNFKIDSLTDGGIIVRKLISEAKNHPSKLNYLSAVDAGLVDSDLEGIENLTELRNLFLRKNPHLTKNALLHIVKCKKLARLDLREIAITPECGKLLKGCRSLEIVTINPIGFTGQQLQTLEKSAPKIQFDVREKADLDLSEDQTEVQKLKRFLK
jgi:hypothetical protein